MKYSRALQKNEPSGFSYERFSKLAHLGAPNYMKLVIEGSRNLTISSLHQVAQALRLDFDETQYFETLTLLGQSKTATEKTYYRRRLSTMKKNKPKKSFRLKHYELIGKWYFPAVVVVLDNCSILEATDKIRNMTGLSLREINEVITVLQKNAMVTEENGKYKVEFSHFVIKDEPLAI